LRQGKWAGKEIVPAAYVAKCGAPSPHNPHYPYSLMFEVNGDKHLAGAPADAFWKSGAGYCIYVVPSLDLVIYKMGGNEGQYNPELTGLTVLYSYDGSRDNWKPTAGAGDGSRKVLEQMVAGARTGDISAGVTARTAGSAFLGRTHRKSCSRACMARPRSDTHG
jgi:hypothetical protein